MDLPIRQIEAEAEASAFDPYDWLGRVLSQFALAEQSIGRLCVLFDLPIEKGPLASMEQLLHRLEDADNKRCRLLMNRIERWRSLESLRNLLAHASVMVVRDTSNREYLVSRHLPLDKNDLTHDRLWTLEECGKLLKQASRDAQSIADHARNLKADTALIRKLRQLDPGSSPG